MYGRIEIEVKHENDRQLLIKGELHNADIADKVFLLLDIAESMEISKIELMAAVMTYDEFKKIGTHTRIDTGAIERMRNGREDH